MKITLLEIEKQIVDGFQDKYRPFTNFMNTKLWNHCMEGVRDKLLLENLIFCNDHLKLPPADIFLKLRPCKEPFTNEDKKAIGAFWGYVFQFVLNYSVGKEIPVWTNTLNNASYFSKPISQVEIVKE